MANNFGNLDAFTIVSQDIVEQLRKALLPIGWALDVSDELAYKGKAVTVHVYQRQTPPASQDISSTAITYGNRSDLVYTPVTITLGTYASDGFVIDELTRQRSPADIVAKSGNMKIWQVAERMQLDVFSEITSANYSEEETVSSAEYTWQVHMKQVVKHALDLGIPKSKLNVVLDNQRFTELVSTIPTLAGIQMNDVLEQGFIKAVGGVTVINSPFVPTGTVGFAASSDALAMAVRPLPPLVDGLSYGQSLVVKSDNGLAIRTRRSQDPQTADITVDFDAVYGFKTCNPECLIRLN